MADYNRALQDDLDHVDVWSRELQQLLPRPERDDRDPVAAHHVGVRGPHRDARRRRLRDLPRVVVVACDPAVAEPEVGDDELGVGGVVTELAAELPDEHAERVLVELAAA